MRAILVRIGIDQAYGGWNAPVDSTTGQFVYVLIPDGATKEHTLGSVRRYGEMQGPFHRSSCPATLGFLALAGVPPLLVWHFN